MPVHENPPFQVTPLNYISPDVVFSFLWANWKRILSFLEPNWTKTSKTQKLFLFHLSKCITDIFKILSALELSVSLCRPYYHIVIILCNINVILKYSWVKCLSSDKSVFLHWKNKFLCKLWATYASLKSPTLLLCLLFIVDKNISPNACSIFRIHMQSCRRF